MKPKSNPNSKLSLDRHTRIEMFLDFDPVRPGWPPIDATEKMGQQQQNGAQLQASETPRTVTVHDGTHAIMH